MFCSSEPVYFDSKRTIMALLNLCTGNARKFTWEHIGFQKFSWELYPGPHEEEKGAGKATGREGECDRKERGREGTGRKKREEGRRREGMVGSLVLTSLLFLDNSFIASPRPLLIITVTWYLYLFSEFWIRPCKSLKRIIYLLAGTLDRIKLRPMACHVVRHWNLKWQTPKRKWVNIP